MQKYGGLKVTGKLDKSTLQLMQSKRCGNVDIEKQIYTNDVDLNTNRMTRSIKRIQDVNMRIRRQRRYALNGEKWPTNKVSWK